MNLEEVKAKLALACRLLYMEGLLDHAGLVAARIPGESRLVLNPRTMRGTRGRHPGIMAAEDMVVVDAEGHLIQGENDPPSETPIFTEILRSRPDMNACFHLHLNWSTLFSTINRPLVPIMTQAAVFGEVPVHPDSNLIQTKAQGEALSATLGNARAVLMRNHGAAVVGEDIESCFAASVLLEQNAQKLYNASLLGQPRILEGKERLQAAERTWQGKVILKVWDYFNLKMTSDAKIA